MIQTQVIEVEIDATGNKFLVRCPMWANDLVRDFASCRWNKNLRCWSVPITRANAKYLSGLITQGAVYASDEVKNKAANAGASEIIKAGEWPSWFNFKTDPMDHQLRGIKKMYPLVSQALHMDRGTGKTKMVIDMACAYRMEGVIDAMMVVCKLTLRKNWEEEFGIHGPIEPQIFLPSDSEDKKFDKWLSNSDFPVFVVGIESLSQGNMFKLAHAFMLAGRKTYMAVDESHRIANIKASRTERCVDYGKHAVRRVTMSGTPTKNAGPMDLFAQFEFLDTNIIGYGDYYAFRNRYAVMGGYHNSKTGKPMEIVGYKNMDELAKTISPYVFEVAKEDVLDLPPKVFRKNYIKLSPEQKKLYIQIKKEKAFLFKGEEIVIKNTLELALRLHQVCGGHISCTVEEEVPDGFGGFKIKRKSEWQEIVPPDRNPKMIELMDILESNDVPTIIWTAYIPELKAISKLLREKYGDNQVGEIHGGIKEEERDITTKKFQANKIKYLLSNAATGGEGYTWTAAYQVIYFNNTEKMVDRQQSEDRPHRKGLAHSVLYIDIIAEHTVDETILKSLASNMDLAQYIRNRIREFGRADEIINELGG